MRGPAHVFRLTPSYARPVHVRPDGFLVLRKLPLSGSTNREFSEIAKTLINREIFKFGYSVFVDPHSQNSRDGAESIEKLQAHPGKHATDRG
jgi:hypothetical protein